MQEVFFFVWTLNLKHRAQILLSQIKKEIRSLVWRLWGDSSVSKRLVQS